MDISHTVETTEFKKAFWNWFDSLSKAEKDKFKYYPSDMAELYFYNKIYRHAQVAQWLEPVAHNGLVGGSSPFLCTIIADIAQW